ncbi:TPA: nickel pincer cofactor biosynthesis protein LarC [Candidatus Poribacteria bacterium]|nr:nickel pincer cofactor biosynthesis protein LarC [Candidatus Poribacteria bacterium]
MKKVAYFDCFSGISGDMTLGVLVDLGLKPEVLKDELLKLNLDGYKISFNKVQKHGITGTKVDIELDNHDHHHEHNHHGRHLSDIIKLISESQLNQDVKDMAEKIFTRLGEAEAKVHNVDIEKIHFHEVGAVDSILDIVGSAIGINALEIDKIYSSPLPLGQGFVKSSHGVIPVPAPATVELLRGIPAKRTEVSAELVTPTGAAIISTITDSFGPIPDMTIENIGYGAGTKDFTEQPNLLRVIIGTSKDVYESDVINVVETNIDDMSPQVYDLLMDKLFSIGALDVFLTPILMKKNRPAIKLTVLVESTKLQEACACILSETTTMGVRIYEANRKKLAREMTEIETEYGKVNVKLGKIGDEVIKIIPEYDNCKQLAEKNNVPIMKVHQAVLTAFSNIK